jgi:hypothetical protein
MSVPSYVVWSQGGVPGTSTGVPYSRPTLELCTVPVSSCTCYRIRASILLLRPAINVRGTSVEIGVPTDVGHWSEQMHGHRFFILLELH